MATFTQRKNNNVFEIQFKDLSGRQRQITLSGKVFTRKTAEELKEIVEILLYNEINSIRRLDSKTQNWLETAPPKILDKLSRVGLIRIPQKRMLGELWDTFFKEKEGTVKETTFTTYLHSRRRFFDFFKENEFLNNLTKDRMMQWRLKLLSNLAEASTAGTIAKTRAVFNWAVENEWIETNPMKGVPQGSFRNKKKDFEVTTEMYYRLIDACPCSDWKAIIALSRIGGLRAPSEILRLRWTDVHWEKNCFYVSSSKTEHHDGKEGRLVPLFTELRQVLYLVRETTCYMETGFIINRYRDPERTNLGTQFARIAKMAGLEPIPRPFDNMRASRSTEIYNASWGGPFFESQWLGHSTKMARDYYLQVRDVDFLLASKSSLQPFADATKENTPQIIDPNFDNEDQKLREN